MKVYFCEENGFVVNVSEYFVLPSYIEKIEYVLGDVCSNMTLENAIERAEETIDLLTLKNTQELAANGDSIIITFIDGNTIEAWNSEWGGINFSFDIKEG